MRKEIYTDINYIHFKSIDSTNSEAKRYVMTAHSLPRMPVVFTADSQTDGRGRMGRSFFSPALTGLYYSLLIPLSVCSDTVRLTSLAAVAAAEAIEEAANAEVGIKWVNDLYLNGRKIAGILAESFERDGVRFAVIGIGINISTADFPTEIKNKAGALFSRDMSESELSAIRESLKRSLTDRLLSALGSADSAPYMQKYRDASVVLGKRIRFAANGKESFGRAVGIADTGALEVELDTGGRATLSSGEISVFVEEGEEI